jgi:hypothetical protein
MSRLTERILHRILHRMKLTALIPDQLLLDVKKRAGCATTTDCVIVALQEWVATKELEELSLELRKSPLMFQAGFSAARVRAHNRRSRG